MKDSIADRGPVWDNSKTIISDCEMRVNRPIRGRRSANESEIGTRSEISPPPLGVIDADWCIYRNRVAGISHRKSRIDCLFTLRPPFQIHKRTLSQSLAETAVLAAGHALDNLSEWLDTRNASHQPVGHADKPKFASVAAMTPQIAAQMQQRVRGGKGGGAILYGTQDAVAQQTQTGESNLDKLTKSRVPRDPLISPMYASDEMLRQLPPMWLVVSERGGIAIEELKIDKGLRLVASE